DYAVVGVRLLQSIDNHGDRDLVRHQLAAVHELFRLHSKRRLSGHGVAKHVAARNVHHAQIGSEGLRLSALSGPRRTNQHNVHSGLLFNAAANQTISSLWTNGLQKPAYLINPR